MGERPHRPRADKITDKITGKQADARRHKQPDTMSYESCPTVHIGSPEQPVTITISRQIPDTKAILLLPPTSVKRSSSHPAVNHIHSPPDSR